MSSAAAAHQHTLYTGCVDKCIEPRRIVLGFLYKGSISPAKYIIERREYKYGYLYIQYGASLSLCVVYTYPAQKHRIEKCGAYIWRCAGNWIYIASLSFNRWICRHLHVFMIISSSSSITFSRNTTFSIYISFDC